MTTHINPLALNLDTNLSGFLKVANEAPVFSAEEEAKLARRFHDENDVNAARELVISQLRNVIHVAKGFTGYGLPVADLIQEGNIGLMKAVKNFDPNRGIRLVSYAVHWIKAEIYEYVLKNWKIVKIATTKAQRKLFFNLRKSRKSLAALSQQETKDIAKNLDVPEKTVREMEVRINSKDVAFENNDNEEDEFSANPASYLPDMRYNPEEIVSQAQTSSLNKASLLQAIANLDARSQDILQSRWLAEKKATLHDLADKYSVSAERIRQIEKQAMDKIKTQLIA